MTTETATETIITWNAPLRMDILSIRDRFSPIIAWTETATGAGPRTRRAMLVCLYSQPATILADWLKTIDVYRLDGRALPESLVMPCRAVVRGITFLAQSRWED